MATDVRKLEDMTDIKDLKVLAEKLNAETDALQAALQTTQDKLNALRLGVEVWLDREPISASEWSDIEDEGGSPTGAREYLAEELGYGRDKYGDQWALLVRTRRYVEGPDSRGYTSQEEYFHSAPRPLLGASRALRIAAVEHLPQLVDALKEHAAKALASIEKAKKLADSIE
jgi:hypothetical protein